LTGSIPDLSQSTGLLWFLVQRNQLSGTIPSLPAALADFGVGHNQLTGSVPAATMTLASGITSSLCPNPLDLTPSVNDSGWNAATGHTPWWAVPYTNNACDDLFTGIFE
jgi:hypothetical protein